MCEVPMTIRHDVAISDGAFRVLTELYALVKVADRYDPFAWATPSYIAQVMGRSVQTVYRALRQLVQIGCIERDTRNGLAGFKLTPHPRKGEAKPRKVARRTPPAQSQDCPLNESGLSTPTPKAEKISGPETAQPILRSENSNIIGSGRITPPLTPQGGTTTTTTSGTEGSPSEQPELFALSRPSPEAESARPKPKAKSAAKPKPRRRAPTGAAPRGSDPAEIRQVYDVYMAALAALAERIGEKPPSERQCTLGAREDWIALAISKFGVEALCDSLRNRGEIGHKRAFDILKRARTPFRPGMVKIGLDREELKALAKNDVPDDGPRVTRTEVAPKL